MRRMRRELSAEILWILECGKRRKDDADILLDNATGVGAPKSVLKDLFLTSEGSN